MSNGIGSADNFVNLYSSRALLFQLNPETRTSWLPKGDKPIDVSFVASIRSEQDVAGAAASAKRKLKIIGTNELGEMVLDAVILPNTNFDKRAPKFGQWIDHTRTLYGLGFDSEPELNEFMATFKQLQQDILTPPLTIPLGANSSRHSNTSGGTHHINDISGGSNTLGRNNNLNSGSNNLQSNHSLNNAHGNNSNHNISANSETFNKQQSTSSSNGATGPSPGILQYENEQLKQALEESSKNAQVWHDELLALRTNNVKLTQALMESKANVSEWQRELNNLRSENKQLKMRLESVESSLEMDKDEVDEYKEGCIKYKNLAHDFQNKLQDKSAEVENLRIELKELRLAGNGINQQDNGTASDQLEPAFKKQELIRINLKLEAKVRELEDIHEEIAQLMTGDDAITARQS